MTDFTIYTDGACLGNPGMGGWAYVILKAGKEVADKSGREEATTNNRMELMAMLRALKRIPAGSSVTLISDSKYALGGFFGPLKGYEEYCETRFECWVANQWKGLQNIDLLLPLFHESKRLKITPQWVAGHSGDKYNTQCDKAAGLAAKFSFDKLRTRPLEVKYGT